MVEVDAKLFFIFQVQNICNNIKPSQSDVLTDKYSPLITEADHNVCA